MFFCNEYGGGTLERLGDRGGRDHTRHQRPSRQLRGSTAPIKCIRSEKIRHKLKGIHYWRAWLSYMAATMRQHHHKLAFDFALAEMGECLRQRAAEGERVDLGYLLGNGNHPVGADNLHHLFQRLHQAMG